MKEDGMGRESSRNPKDYKKNKISARKPTRKSSCLRVAVDGEGYNEIYTKELKFENVSWIHEVRD